MPGLHAGDAAAVQDDKSARQDLVTALLGAAVWVSHSDDQLHRLADAARRAGDPTAAGQIDDAIAVIVETRQQLIACADQLTDPPEQPQRSTRPTE